jgi:hypothetical protein
MVLAVCMEQMFESLLVQDERAAKRALGLDLEPKRWPRNGWTAGHRRPDKTLQQAITAMQRIRPRPRITGQIRGDMMTKKDDWGEYLLRSLMEDETSRPLIVRHRICTRLTELLARNT